MPIGNRGLSYYAPFSYGYNAMGTDVQTPNPLFSARGLGAGVQCSFGFPGGATYPGRELRANRVRVPAEMIAITDSATWGSLDIGVDCFGVIPVSRADFTTWHGFTTPSPVHSGGTNVLFCDGHVQWYPTDDLIINEVQAVLAGRSPSSLLDQQVARMWNNDHEP